VSSIATRGSVCVCGGGEAEMSCDIFGKILDHIFVLWPAFGRVKLKFSNKFRLVFENQNGTS